MSPTDARPYLWMLCGSFSFAVMAILAEALTHASGESPPLCDWQTVAVFRAGLVALFAALLAKYAGVRLVWWQPARLWVRSIAGSCSMICTFYAFGNLRSSDVVTLSNTFPLWVAVLSWPLYGRLPNGKTLLAILTGVIGVALVEQPHLESGNWGVVAALAAAAFTAIAMLGLHCLHDIDPRAVVVHFSVVATVFCVATYWLTPHVCSLQSLMDYRVALMLVGIGISATIGQVFLTLAFGRGAPAKVSVVGLMQIVFVLLMSIVIFGHSVNGLALLGTGLVVAPTAWLLMQPKPPVSHNILTKIEIPGNPRSTAAVQPPPRQDAAAADHPLDTPSLRP